MDYNLAWAAHGFDGFGLSVAGKSISFSGTSGAGARSSICAKSTMVVSGAARRDFSSIFSAASFLASSN